MCINTNILDTLCKNLSLTLLLSPSLSLSIYIYMCVCVCVCVCVRESFSKSGLSARAVEYTDGTSAEG